MRGGVVIARVVVGVVLFATTLLVSSPTPLEADPEVARFLVEKAKKAIALRKYDEAVTKLLRAREEDPEQPEAGYLLGQVYEKMKQPGNALAAYRAFRDTCRARERAGTLDKKAARLLGRAEKRIGILGKGEKELEKLAASFSDQVVRFATRVQGEDPDIAIHALRTLLGAHPGVTDAEKLLAELAGTDDLTRDTESAGGVVPIRGIRLWDDVLRRRAIVPSSEVSYQRKVLTVDQRDGSIFWATGPTRAPNVFVYDMEFRVTKAYSPSYLVGFAFAKDEDAEREGRNEWVMAFAQKSSVVIVHASNGQNIDVGEAAVKSVREGTWRRLTIAVEGRKVRLYLDGKRRLSSSIPGRKSLAGPVGMFHQRCVCEVRLFRLGTRK